MKIICIFVFYCILASACNEKVEQDRQPLSTTVTIIFKDAPNHSSTQRLGGGLLKLPEGSLIFVDSALNRVYYTPRTIGYDTLTVSAPFGYAEVIHRNQAIEDIPYLLFAGDTVLFTYGNNLRPQIRSIKSDENTWLYNLPHDDACAIQPVGYSTKTVLNRFEYRIANEIRNHPKRDYPTDIVSESKKYYINLDSLRPIYDTYLCEFRTRLDSLERNGVLPMIYADYYREQLAKPISDIPDSVPSDSLMHYISHYNNAIAYKYRITPKNANSPQQFDAIAADTILSPIVKKAILHDIMSSIETGDYWRAYPAETVLKYRDKYQQITGDTTFQISVVNKENLIENGYSTDLILKDLEGKQTTYGDILGQHKGKVVYVDMWASWCGPCRAGMPDAKTLREEYNGKDVVFIYLAINDTDDAWQGAVRNCKTDYLGANYRVLNAGESQFLKQIKHTRIPHLLLYDRTGKLVNLDAPRPESEEIRPLLNKYL